MINKTWTEEELDHLREIYPTGHEEHLAEVFGRSWGAVKKID